MTDVVYIEVYKDNSFRFVGTFPDRLRIGDVLGTGYNGYEIWSSTFPELRVGDHEFFICGGHPASDHEIVRADIDDIKKAIADLAEVLREYDAVVNVKFDMPVKVSLGGL